nr:uncharacterized protein LOC128687253 isoform X2 [Cherax quadricarinatus]
MNSPEAMENEVQLLEVVSSKDEESEHEEGEISEDDDEDFNPERRSSKKISAIASEVVIYNDFGRTAIFTSPKKKKKSGGETSSYPRVSEGVRRWSREDSGRWREKDEGSSKHQKDGGKSRRRPSVQLEDVEPVVRKKTKRKSQSGQKVRGKTELADAHGDPPHRKKATYDVSHRHRSPSSACSSDTSSCSNGDDDNDDDDDDSSPRLQRSRGKENKGSGSLKACARSPLHYGSSRPISQGSSSKLPPLHKSHSQKSTSKHTWPKSPSVQKYVYRKSPLLHSYFKSSKGLGRGSIVARSQKLCQTKLTKDKVGKSSKVDLKTVFKADQPSKEKIQDSVLMKGQKQPPPGSLGEMLLKKTLKGKLKVRPEAGEPDTLTDKESGVNTSGVKRDIPMGELTMDIAQECYTLDQEDDEELQLRLIALQSSLRVLSDVRKEGQDLMSSSLVTKLPQVKSNEAEGENSQPVDFDQLQQSLGKFSLCSNSEGILESSPKSDILEYLNEMGKDDDSGDSSSVEAIEPILDELSQSSPQSAATPDSIREIAIDTNKSYIGDVDSGKLVQNAEEINKDVKELSDCNQDPIDMDICDSSPGEDDGDTLEEEVFQEIGDDISLSNKESLDKSVKNILNDCSNTVKESSTSSGGPEGSQHNFQIPVEWAYMMPPPPPPDQPANDLSNINNWCYDQNMYLQTMQTQYDSNPQYNHYGLQGVTNAEWGVQQSQSPQWNCSPNEDHENNLTNKAVGPPKASTSQEGDESHSCKVEKFEENDHMAEPQKDLKDLPAEQYQAFMSVVLKQQTSQPKQAVTNDNSQRTLIEVPLIKDVGKGLSHNCERDQLLSKIQLNTSKRKRRRERQKYRIKQLKRKMLAGSKIIRQLEPVIKDTVANLKSEPVPEEEDEDLLRAKLLIDLSIKNQQKTVASRVKQVPAASVESSQYSCYQKKLDKLAFEAREASDSSPVPSYPSSSESSPVARTRVSQASLHKNVHKLQARIKEGSPTHKFRTDSRQSLSDIGGIGLDPKSSQYDYAVPHDANAESESPKFMFPLVKPVIINLKSDSEDETEEGRVENQTKSRDPKTVAEPKASSSGAISNSIDRFLKSIRNRDQPGEEFRSIKENARASRQNSAGISSRCKTAAKDSTPNVVRHLSRTQQMEYRLLKEKLREKELLHLKKQLQQRRPTIPTKKNRISFADSPESPDWENKSSFRVVSADHSDKCHIASHLGPERESIHDCPEAELKSGNLGMSNSREVCFKEMGRLQIQLANISSYEDQSNVTSSEEAGESGRDEPQAVIDTVAGESSQEVSGAEEDEETLRMMVFQTLQKKASDRKEQNQGRMTTLEFPQNEATASEDKKSATTLRVVIHQKVDDTMKKEYASQDNVRKVIIQQSETESHKDHQDVDMGGEWMVLDEVLGEGIEGNGGNHTSDGEEGKLCDEFGNEVAKEEIERECRSLVVTNSIQTINNASGMSDISSRLRDDGINVDEMKERVSMSSSKIAVAESKCNVKIDNLNKASHEMLDKFENRAGNENTSQRLDLDKTQSCKSVSELKQENVETNVDCVDGQKVRKVVSCSSDGIEVRTDVGTRNSDISESENSRATQREPDLKINKDGGNLCGSEGGSTLRDQSLTSDIISSSAELIGSLFECDREEKKPGTGICAELKEGESIRNKDRASCLKNNQCLDSSIKTQEVLSETLKLEPEKVTGYTEESKIRHNVAETVDFCSDISPKVSEVKKHEYDSNSKKFPSKLTTVEHSLKSETQGISSKNSETSTEVRTRVKQLTSLVETVKHPANKDSSAILGKCESSSAKVQEGPGASRKGKAKDNQEKPVNSKKMMLLKRIEQEYTEKRLGFTKVISVLASLVQEAREEELQRQSLKKNVLQLRAQLKQMEGQLETKSSAVKTKMESIRELQTQITKDRLLINELEQKGKLLGQQEFGSSYSLPKVLGSPHSKTKEAFRKKQLASNIDALRQQMRDVSNKSKARLQVAALKADDHGHTGNSKGLLRADKNPATESRLVQMTGTPNCYLGKHGTAIQGNVKNAAKTLFQAEELKDKINQQSSKATSSSKSKDDSTKNLSFVNNELKRKEPPSSDERVVKVAKIQDGGRNNTCEEKASPGGGKNLSAALCPRQLVGQSPIQRNKAHLDKLEGGEKLDEMNVLCPYDLLGRCNDDSCTYQHLAQPRNGSCGLMSPAASLTAKTEEQLRCTKTGMGRAGSNAGTGRIELDTSVAKMKSDMGKGKPGPNLRAEVKKLDKGSQKTGLNMEQERPGPDVTVAVSGTGKKSSTMTGGIGPDIGAEKTRLDTLTGMVGPSEGLIERGPCSEKGSMGPSRGMKLDAGTGKTKPDDVGEAIIEKTPVTEVTQRECSGHVDEAFIPLDFRIKEASLEASIKPSVSHAKGISSNLKEGVHTVPALEQENTNVHEKLKRERECENSLVNSVSTEEKDNAKHKRCRVGSEDNTSECDGTAILCKNEFKDVSENSHNTVEKETLSNESNRIMEEDIRTECKEHLTGNLAEVNTVKETVKNCVGDGKTNQGIEIGGVPYCMVSADGQEIHSFEPDMEELKGFQEISQEIKSDSSTRNNNLNTSISFGNLLYEPAQEKHKQLKVKSVKVLSKGKKKEDSSENLLPEIQDESCQLLDSNAKPPPLSRRPVRRRKAQSVNIAAVGKSNVSKDLSNQCRTTRAAGRRSKRGVPETVVNTPPKDSLGGCSESGANRRDKKTRATKNKRNRGRGSASRGRKR